MFRTNFQSRPRCALDGLKRGAGRGVRASAALVGGLTALVALLAGCSREAPPDTGAPLVRPVKSVVVAPEQSARTRTLSGRVEAANKVDLAFQVPGLLIDLPIKEGQRVAQGDLIARLRPDEFEARLKTLEAQLAQSRAGLDALRLGERPEERLRREAQVRAAAARVANGQAEFDRMARLVVTNAVSRSEYERAETALRVMEEELAAARLILEKGAVGREEEIQAQEAAVRALEGRVREAAIQLRDCTLAAPFDGVISQVFVRQGQTIRVAEPTVRFQDVDEIDIAVDVPEAIMAGDVRSTGIDEMAAEFSVAPGRRFPVRVREIAQAADPITQTFLVRVAMQAPADLNVLPGMTASVTMTFRRPAGTTERILVPVSAVHKDSSGEQVVWIIGPDGAVQRRPIRLGEPAGGAIEVAEGLQPGDRIAVAGVRFLRDGLRVRDLGDALGGVGR
ncbi:MAG TPA: efflux RND transporter periplasmic adaptor subunit [Phycisphaerales bacterium]|nr:efflux RND transporter periplasmic adaptor subunit [Phycisphaerales bacterium]